MWSFENGECKKYVVRSVENAEVKSCGVWKVSPHLLSHN